MKIKCGSTMYRANERLGTVVGFRIQAYQDRLVGLVFRGAQTDVDCQVVPFGQILSAGTDRVEVDPTAAPESLESVRCGEDEERLRHWIANLTDHISLPFGSYSLADDEDMGAFSISDSRLLDLPGCDCGWIAYVEVDAMGDIRQVGVYPASDLEPIKVLRPVPKRRADEEIDVAHRSLNVL